MSRNSAMFKSLLVHQYILENSYDILTVAEESKDNS